MLKKIIITSVFLLLVPVSQAYIPHYSTLLSKLASLQGRGNYIIEQEVSFKTSSDNVTVREKWYIAKNGHRRVDISLKTDNQDIFRILYLKKYKIFQGDKKKAIRKRISPYHIEMPFHLRDAEKLASLFFGWQVAPLKAKKRGKEEGSDPFVRLSRRQGVVQYEIGTKKSRLWLEQDEFTIREWLWSSGTRLIAQDYVSHPGNLFFPSRRIFKWSSYEVVIDVKKLERVKELSEKLFQKSVLNKKPFHLKDVSDSDQDQIREFYHNFR